jgi:FdhD protein
MPDPKLTEAQQLSPVTLRRYGQGSYQRTADQVAVEAPLEIRVGYHFKQTHGTESAAITMRTPGYEKELALGFLLSEGVIQSLSDVAEARLLGSGECGEVLVELAPHVDVENWRFRRATLLNSACGLCGKRTVESIASFTQPVSANLTVSPDLVYRLPSLLQAEQAGFTASGGLHAAALVSPQGEVLGVFEDIGRHNALDKLIGHCLLTGLAPLAEYLIFMSSRGSFELVQKALAAGCGVLATIGAPSSLAVEFARDRALTLIGFIRSDHFNVYSGEWRIHS